MRRLAFATFLRPVRAFGNTTQVAGSGVRPRELTISGEDMAALGCSRSFLETTAVTGHFEEQTEPHRDLPRMWQLIYCFDRVPWPPMWGIRGPPVGVAAELSEALARIKPVDVVNSHWWGVRAFPYTRTALGWVAP